MTALAERLGFAPDDRIVILSARGLGTSHASSAGALAALRTGAATTGSLMVPGPWSRHATAGLEARDDVGVELTLNASYNMYRWGPVTHAPSLVDGEGGFPRTVEDTWDHADVDEVRRECRTQAERALEWGVDVTHLGGHLGVLALRPEFFDVFLEIATELDVPIQLPPASLIDHAGFPIRSLAEYEGVLHPDNTVDVRSRSQLVAGLADLAPGVTEFALRPALDTPELRAYAADWASQVEAHSALVGDAEILEALRAVHCIGYRRLRDAQRTAR